MTGLASLVTHDAKRSENGLFELGRNLAVTACVRPFLSRQRGQAKLPTQPHPTLSGAEYDSRRRRERLQPTVIVHLRLEQVKSIEGAPSGLSRKPRQFVHSRRIPKQHAKNCARQFAK
jgi:hypothetical protein